MRPSVYTLRIAFVLMAALAPAFAASKGDHADCNSDDVDRNIKGCTVIIDDKSESDTVRAIAYVARGLALHDKGDLDRAMSDLDNAIRLNPQDALAYSDRGIMWRERRDVDRAIADFTEAIRLNPQPRSDLAGPGHVNIYTNRGLAFQAKGDLDRAMADFDQAIRLDNNDVDAYYYRAQAHVALHQYEFAVGDLDLALQRDPNRVSARYLRGVLRFDLYVAVSDVVKQSDLDGAIADLSEVIRLDPKHVWAYRARAEAWNIDGKRDRVIADLMEAVKLDPSNRDTIAMLKQLKPDYEPPADP